jgi:hypothetical protein
MALKLNGSTSILSHAARIITSYPCSLTLWVSADGSGATQAWVTQQGAAVDRAIAGILLSNGTTFGGYVQAPGASSFAASSGAVIPSATMRLLVLSFASQSSVTVFYGNNSGATTSLSTTDDLSTHDSVTVGAWQYNGASANAFTNGSVAEAHFYSAALTSSNVTDLLADSVKPEDVTGWIDGWTLKDFAAGGTYTSIGGTRTLTAAGGVTASGQSHPITRASAPTLTGTITLDAFTLSGAFATGALSQLSGGITLDGFVLSGFLGLAPGRIDSNPFKNWTGTLLAGVTIPRLTFLRLSDMSTVLQLTNQATAGDGVLTVTNAALIPGTTYVVVAASVDGASLGAEIYTAT